MFTRSLYGSLAINTVKIPMIYTDLGYFLPTTTMPIKIDGHCGAFSRTFNPTLDYARREIAGHF
jgi:hypothetical protein